jgi:hypothetical protein
MLMQDSAGVVLFGEVDDFAHHFIGMPAVVGGTGHSATETLKRLRIRCTNERLTWRFPLRLWFSGNWKMSSQVPTTISVSIGYVTSRKRLMVPPKVLL